MRVINFESQKRISPLAPEWNYFMCEAEIHGVDWSEVSKIILEKEKEILISTKPVDKSSGDGYTGLGANSLTSRYDKFNVFSWDYPVIKEIHRQVANVHREFISFLNISNQKLYLQCWANVMRNGEGMEPHIHDVTPYCYLGGHITVQCNDTSTVYINPINQINEPQEYRSLNKPGKITLFQNNIPHYTTLHFGDLERISIAFDIVLQNNCMGRSNLVPLE